MQINDYINYYYSNFMAAKDFIETLCYTSFESIIPAEEYQQSPGDSPGCCCRCCIPYTAAAAVRPRRPSSPARTA